MLVVYMGQYVTTVVGTSCVFEPRCKWEGGGTENVIGGRGYICVETDSRGGGANAGHVQRAGGVGEEHDDGGGCGR